MQWFRSTLLLLIVFGLTACQQQLADRAQEQEKIKKTKAAAKYYTQLGVGYINQRDYPRAKKKLLKALRLAPDAAECNAAMAYYLEKTGDATEAKQYYQKALAANPKSGTQRNNYGTFLCRVGEHEQGLKLLLQAAEDVHYVNSAMAYENAGFCAQLMQHDKQSEAFFTKALQQDPERKTALYALVELLMKHDETARTVKMLKQYTLLTLQEPVLLRIGVEAAKKSGEMTLAADYEQHLQTLVEAKKTKEG